MSVATSFIFSMIAVILIVPAVMIARLGQRILKSSARNSAESTKIFLGMFFLLLFVEGAAIASVVIIFQFFAK